MKIGFTGTQRGMTDAQKHILRRWLKDCSGDEFRHGDCIGADAEAHDIAEECHLCTVIHPPENSSKRAYKVATATLEPKPYLARNKDIVDASDTLIATPAELEEQLRSGTWSTIRYAKKRELAVNIIFPDGTHTMWRVSQTAETKERQEA